MIYWGENSQIMISVLAIFLQILLAKPEPSNVRDKSAVAVFKDGSIVGHVPINMAPILYQFLRREVNKALLKSRVKKWTEVAAMDWKYPMFIVYTVGHGMAIQRLKDTLEPLIAAGHL